MADNDDRRQGGQEPEPEQHDRPEQQKGYDQAVRSGAKYDDAWHHLDESEQPKGPDDREADAAAADVRRRERSAEGQ